MQSQIHIMMEVLQRDNKVHKTARVKMYGQVHSLRAKTVW